MNTSNECQICGVSKDFVEVELKLDYKIGVSICWKCLQKQSKLYQESIFDHLICMGANIERSC